MTERIIDVVMAVVGGLGVGFVWGFYLGVVHGAHAWRKWALARQAKQEAEGKAE